MLVVFDSLFFRDFHIGRGDIGVGIEDVVPHVFKKLRNEQLGEVQGKAENDPVLMRWRSVDTSWL